MSESYKRRTILPNGWIVEGDDEAISAFEAQARKAASEKSEAEYRSRAKRREEKRATSAQQAVPERGPPSELLKPPASPEQGDPEFKRRLAALQANQEALNALAAEARRREDDDLTVLLLSM